MKQRRRSKRTSKCRCRTSHKKRYKGDSSAAGEAGRLSVIDFNPPAGSDVFDKIWGLATDTNTVQFTTEDDGKYFIHARGKIKEITSILPLFYAILTETERVFPNETPQNAGDLRRELVARFSTRKHIYDTECPICFESLQTGNSFIVQCKECSKCFHSNCAYTWSEFDSSCPMCRDEMQWKDRNKLTIVPA